MVNKVSKHLKILVKILKTGSEARRLSKINNAQLSAVYRAYKESKSGNYPREESDIIENCERFRAQLLSSEEVITYEVFNSDRTALVKDVCKKAASSKTWCVLLYNLIKEINPKNVFEVGTNLGVSGSYILSAMEVMGGGKFTSLEGVPKLCEIAEKQFSKICKKVNFNVSQGLYVQTFDAALDSYSEIDCAFIDGNHQLSPTLEYFAKLKGKASPKSIFLFDDINWSSGMQQAWSKIKDDEEVSFTIDLYEIGIVIRDSEYHGPKEHFKFHYAY